MSSSSSPSSSPSSPAADRFAFTGDDGPKGFMKLGSVGHIDDDGGLLPPPVAPEPDGCIEAIDASRALLLPYTARGHPGDVGVSRGQDDDARGLHDYGSFRAGVQCTVVFCGY